MSPLDIDASVRRAIHRSRGWSGGEALTVAHEVGNAHGMVVDWDDDAGETWVRLIRDRVTVAAYLSIVVPIAFSAQNGLWPNGIEVVTVADLAGTVLACGHELLRDTFGTIGSEDFSSEAFTAEDLWYATV